MELLGKKVLVLGLGISGKAAAKLALKQHAIVTLLDARISENLEKEAEKLRILGASVHLNYSELSWKVNVDLIIISPGISPLSTLGQLAQKSTCTVVSELEFGASFCQCPLIAVTGTNGKTTTVELITHCLTAAGLRALPAGNIGKPLSTVSQLSSSLDWIVVEVSSFQLEHATTFTPYMAAFLNVTSDHQDRYNTFEEYFLTKLKIFRAIKKAGHCVVGETLFENRQMRETLLNALVSPLVIGREMGEGKDYFVDKEGILSYRLTASKVEQLLHKDELQLQGAHNIENVLTAIALCQLAAVSTEKIVAAVKTFKGSEHRLEFVMKKGEISFINDSKSTNPDAMICAIQASVQMRESSGKIILIAGGRDKKMDFSKVQPYLSQHVAHVFLIGENRFDLAKNWGPFVECTLTDTLNNAVYSAIHRANSGDTVLLSPGSASQDMFINYVERGNKYKNALKRRLGNV